MIAGMAAACLRCITVPVIAVPGPYGTGASQGTGFDAQPLNATTERHD